MFLPRIGVCPGQAFVDAPGLPVHGPGQAILDDGQRGHIRRLDETRVRVVQVAPGVR